MSGIMINENFQRGGKAIFGKKNKSTFSNALADNPTTITFQDTITIYEEIIEKKIGLLLELATTSKNWKL